MKVMKSRHNNKRNHQFVSAIHGLYFILKYLGLWLQTNSLSWYNLIWYVQSVGMLFHVFGQAAGLIVHRHDTKKVVDGLGFLIPTTCIYTKWLIFSWHQKTVKQLFQFVEEDWNNLVENTSINQNVSDSKRVMAMYSRVMNIFFYTYVTVIIVAMAIFVPNFIVAISDSNNTGSDVVLILPNSWYPLNYNRSYNVQFLAVTQMIFLPTISLPIAAVDITFVSMTLHLCGQFEILSRFIEGFKYDSSKPEICKTKVKLMVKRHQVLLSVGESLQKSYSLIILNELVACTASICLLGYIFLAEFEKHDASKTVLLNTGFICGLTLQGIFSYCFAGDFLTDQSITIATAVYNAQWYNSTRSISVSLSLVMIRAGRPLEITGASFMKMSLESFMSLMKAAASYLSVLRAVGVGEG